MPKGAVMEVERLLASRRTSRVPSAQRAYLVRWEDFDCREGYWAPPLTLALPLT